MSTRYYNPEVGRFLNADAFATTGQGFLGNNMFIYCHNNPVLFVDPYGLCTYTAYEPWRSPNGRYDDCGNWRCPTSSAERDDIGDYLPPSKEEHYSRNKYNPSFPEQYDEEFYKEWDDTVSANCHQFTAPDRDNKKYVSPDGMCEVIYDVNGQIVTDPRDVGTYNFISPNENGWGHGVQDVLPWILYGNSPDDTTNPWQRLLSLGKMYI